MGKIYGGVSGTSREVKAIYAGVEGVAKAVKKVYVGVGGVAQLIWPTGGAVLPPEYQQVLYIQSSGTQYIDVGMGITVTSSAMSFDINMDMEFISIPSDNNGHTISGARNSGSGSSIQRYYTSVNATGWYLGSGTSSTQSSVKPVVEQPYNVVTHLAYGSQTLTIDGTTVVTRSANSMNITRNLYLFRYNYSGTPAYTSMKLYKCKITTQDGVQRDFYPCYRKSDNVAGLYDLANDVFYPNAGTGAFTAGPINEGPL